MCWKFRCSLLSCFLNFMGDILSGYSLMNSYENLLVVNETIIMPPANLQICKEYPCGENAECLFGKLYRFCRCRCGFYGNPHTKCSWMPPTNVWRIKAEISVQIKNMTNDINNFDIYNLVYLLIEKKVEGSETIPNYVQRSLFLEQIRY